MPDAIFKMKFDTVPEWGEEGEFELTRLTRSELSHFKSWYGDEYGQKVTVVTKAIWEDADAVGCIVWACRRQNGLSTVEPKRMPDFDTSEVFVPRAKDACTTCGGTGKVPHIDDEVPEVPLDRTASPSLNDTKTTSLDGSTTETLTSSGTNGSPSSDTSAT